MIILKQFDENKILKLLPLVKALSTYHQHEVKGLERFPRRGPVLVVSNHSLATYDIMLLGFSIYCQYGRLARPLIDRLFFKVPGIGKLMESLGSVQGNQKNARNLLEDKNIVLVAPGGMNESLRSSSEKYKIIWDRRKGFVKLAIETQVPIVLAACPAADDLYDVFTGDISKWAYQTFKLPVFLAKGLGISPIPKPVKLVHFLSARINPPKLDVYEANPDEVLDLFHKKITASMKRLMKKGSADLSNEQS